MEKLSWVLGLVAVCRAAALAGPHGGRAGAIMENPHCQPPQSLQRAFGCISKIDNINYAHCYTLPWERLSIQAHVLKSVRCSWSWRFLVLLNGREQRYSLESCRLGEIASEAEELLLFHTKLPMVRAAFPV